MAIFGNWTESINGTVVPYPDMHNGTSLDAAMNYVYGVTLLAIGIVGVFLNSLVLYEKLSNRQSRRKQTSVLFQLLAAANILVLLLRAAWPVYCLLTPALLPAWEQPVTLWHKVYTVAQFVFCGASTTLVLLICIVRYFKIRYPLQSSSSCSHWCMVAACVGALLVYIVLNIVFPTILNCAVGNQYIGWDYGVFSTRIAGPHGMHIIPMMDIVIAWMSFSGLASLLFSSLAICSLRSSAGQSLSDANRKSTYTIVWLNIPDMMCPVISLFSYLEMCGVVDLLNDDAWSYSQFFMWVMFQPITATYYAAIICARSSTIKKLLAGWWRTLHARGRGYQPI